MQRSTDRIYTTHVGSLARPAGLLELMQRPRAAVAHPQHGVADVDPV